MCTRSQAERAGVPASSQEDKLRALHHQTATHCNSQISSSDHKAFQKTFLLSQPFKKLLCDIEKSPLDFAGLLHSFSWSWYQAAMRPHSAYIVDGNLRERGFWTCPSVHFQVITSWLINTFRTQNMNFPYCSWRSGCQALAIRIMSGEGRGLASTFGCTAQEAWLTAETAPTSGWKGWLAVTLRWSFKVDLGLVRKDTACPRFQHISSWASSSFFSLFTVSFLVLSGGLKLSTESPDPHQQHPKCSEESINKTGV